MYRTAVFTTFAVLVASVSAQDSSTCTEETITITSAAQATGLGCSTAGTIVIENDQIEEVNLSGLEEIESLVVANSPLLRRIESSTLTTINGMFNLTELTALSALELSSLQSVGSIFWLSAHQLGSVTFGTKGVTSVDSISISNCFISSLDGLNVATVVDVDINNNRKLTTWTSDLKNITGKFKLQDNGLSAMVVNMPELTLINDMQIRDVQEFNVPLLETVTASMRFESNDNMESFIAPNLTEINEISFTDNNMMTNISFPLLKETSGALTIQNNTALETIDGFPELETIRGTLIFRGSFNRVDTPKLGTVIGQATITSTGDISDSCPFYDDLADSKNIQGTPYACTSNNQKANEGGDGGDTASDNPDDAQGAASARSISMLAALGAIAAYVALL